MTKSNFHYDQNTPEKNNKNVSSLYEETYRAFMGRHNKEWLEKQPMSWMGRLNILKILVISNLFNLKQFEL